MVYRPSAISWFVGVVWPGLFVVGSTLFLLVCLVLGLPLAPAFLVGVFLGLFPLLMLLRHIRLFGLRVVTDDEGMSYSLPAGKGRIRWADVASVRYSEQRRGKVSFFANRLFLEIRDPAHGTWTLPIPLHASPLHALSAEVAARTTPRLVSALAADVARGHKVQFGNIWVSRDCLGHLDRWFPWDQVGGAAAEANGTLRVLRAPGLGGGMLCAEPYGNVPNAHVLVAWLNARQ